MNQPPTDPSTLRILHAPINIGGNAGYLAEAQRQAGCEAKALEWQRSSFEYPIDGLIAPEGSTSLFVSEVARFRFLCEAIRRYDVFHFYFGQTILTPRRHRLEFLRPKTSPAELLKVAYSSLIHMLDVPLLKSMGKVVAMTFLGDDIRLVRHARENHEVSHLHIPELAQLYAHRDKPKQRMVRYLSRHIDLMYATNPDLLELLPASAAYLPYTNFSSAVPPAMEHLHRIPKPAGRAFVVAHSPTNRLVKGTEAVINAVARLRQQGIAIDLDLIENVSNTEAKRRMASADVFVDQLLVGWYGGAAIEAMLHGLPTLCYIRPSDLARIGLHPKDLPIIQTNSECLYTDLAKLVAMAPEQRAEIGRASMEFVQRVHDPVKIAISVIEDYRKAKLVMN